MYTCLLKETKCFKSGDLQPSGIFLMEETSLPCRCNSLSMRTSLINGGTLEIITFFEGVLSGSTGVRVLRITTPCSTTSLVFSTVLRKRTVALLIRDADIICSWPITLPTAKLHSFTDASH